VSSIYQEIAILEY